MTTCVQRWFVPVAGALGLMSSAFAGPYAGQSQWKAFRDPTVQDFGHQWSRVGDPHNDAYTYQPPFQPPRSIGLTNYKYRVMTHEVTVREWFDFVRAYAPFVAPNAAGSQQLIGTNGFIQFAGFSNGVPQYFMQPQFGNVPIQVGWRFAARYANFLHNDQVHAAWAFETGAYDTSTFGQAQNDQGLNYITDQQARSEGARYFLPTFDEWTKAGHWDPNRYGEGQGGYWLYPTTSDTAPVSGAPDQGGETNGGPFPPGQVRPLDVGSYPDVQSPWGLLDVSGGAHEWMEDVGGLVGEDMPQTRLIGGSSIYNTLASPAFFDHVGRSSGASPTSLSGVRLASVIPAPGAVPVAVLALGLLLRRNRPCGTHWPLLCHS